MTQEFAWRGFCGVNVVKPATTVVNTSTRTLLNVFQLHGFDAHSVIAEVENCSDLLVPYARLDVATVHKIWHDVYEISGDGIGFATAAALPPGAFGVLDYLLSVLPTLGDVFSALGEFYPLINSGAILSARREKNSVALELKYPPNTPPGLVKRATEFTFAVFVRRFQEMTGCQSLRPLHVDFAHSSNDRSLADEKYFGAEIRFLRRLDALYFDEQLLSMPLLRTDAALAERLKWYADGLLNGSYRGAKVVDDVRAVLTAFVGSDRTGVQTTSRELGMSTRDLQRKLNACGTSYQAILDQVRCENALHCLSDGLSAVEISYLLGFSEPSAFSRAFKTWTGKSVKHILSNS